MLRRRKQEETAGALAPRPQVEPREDAVAQRAYEISQSEEGGSPEENWLRAERELRGESQPESA